MTKEAMRDSVCWGRTNQPRVISKMVMISVFFAAPFACLGFLLANVNHEGSFSKLYKDWEWEELYVDGDSFWSIGFILGSWILSQYFLALLPDFLHLVLPGYVGGIQKGQATPAGNVLKYNVNGLQAWLISHMCFIFLIWWGWFDPRWIVREWLACFYWANIIGYTLTFFAYFKAHYFPTYPKDNKVTSSRIFNFIMGVEFNPRLCGVDFKLFFNGRPGIIAWSMLNLCCVFYQYKEFGHITNSIILLNILQGLYVVDFFWNERWYLKTIDICHDHFGFYLAWGDCVWLPFMYTLQGFYLARHEIELSMSIWWSLMIIGSLGYLLFRWANYQKDYFRRKVGLGDMVTIWGRPATFIPCTYSTNDGKRRKSFLLTSGFWGWARHMNYTGDILLSATWCLCCGTNHILPYFYLAYIILLLLTRTWRDEARCKGKYGEKVWNNYCTRVPKRFLPYFF